jgi:hypothetical protein
VPLRFGCASSSGFQDISSSHARLGTGEWLTLTGYGLPVNILVDRSQYQRHQALLGVPTGGQTRPKILRNGNEAKFSGFACCLSVASHFLILTLTQMKIYTSQKSINNFY